MRFCTQKFCKLPKNDISINCKITNKRLSCTKLLCRAHHYEVEWRKAKKVFIRISDAALIKFPMIRRGCGAYSRAPACKYREFSVKTEISDPVIFGHKSLLGALFENHKQNPQGVLIFWKSAETSSNGRDYVASALKCCGEFMQVQSALGGKTPGNIQIIFHPLKEYPIFFLKIVKIFL